MAKSGAEAEADDDVWALAKRRADVIRTLLATGGTSLDPAAVRAATAELGAGRTTLYRFISQFRAAEVTSTLLPSRRGRPAWAQSLDAEREKIIAEEIETYYLRAERPRCPTSSSASLGGAIK